MSAVPITKNMFHCKCEARNKFFVVCAYEWDAEEIPQRCPKCKSRKWNRSYRRSTLPPITFNGVTLTRSGWAKKLGISKTAIRWRINQGWPIEQVLSIEDWRVQK